MSALIAVNLNLFYGFGFGGRFALPTIVAGIDLTLVLAVVNVAVIFWHIRLFEAHCARRTDATLELAAPRTSPGRPRDAPTM